MQRGLLYVEPINNGRSNTPKQGLREMNTNRNSRRNMNFETMEKKELFAADLGMHLDVDGLVGPKTQAPAVAEIDFVEVAGNDSSEGEPVCYLKYKLDRAFIKSWSTSGDADDRPTAEQAAILVKTPSIGGDVEPDGQADAGYDAGKYFVADSFSFGVEREMKESGEKGGTADINIGVGELQECTISKSMDTASAKLAQAAINGNSCGVAEIDFVEVGGTTSRVAVDAVFAA